MNQITNPRRARSRLPELLRWTREIADHLDGAKFDLDSFTLWRNHKKEPRNVTEASHCGFVGCIAGWALLNPRFRKAGLAVRKLALDQFFGISASASKQLFAPYRPGFDNPGARHNPRIAARRIERFCAENGIEVGSTDAP